MNRRGFFCFLAALPAVGYLPSVRARAKREPETVAELKAMSEALFADARMMLPRAYVEFEAPLGFGLAPTKAEGAPVYRVVAVTWVKNGTSERRLIRAAWLAMQKASRGRERDTLFWRLTPDLVASRGFPSGRVALSLRFRAAVLPHDWERKAREGAHHEDAFANALGDGLRAEGASTVWLS